VNIDPSPNSENSQEGEANSIYRHPTIEVSQAKYQVASNLPVHDTISG
jgi:hypothetical protein